MVSLAANIGHRIQWFRAMSGAPDYFVGTWGLLMGLARHAHDMTK
jgi:hypothetical protein